MYQMKIQTAQQNEKNLKVVYNGWNLGPDKTSVKAEDNKEYWSKMSKIWDITETEARTQMCANCEYYNNSANMMMQMNSIPLNKLDLDGGGRGYCHKFDFICHNLRTCQAWEAKEFKLEHPAGFDKIFIKG